VDWINLAQGGYKWWVPVERVIKLGVSQIHKYLSKYMFPKKKSVPCSWSDNYCYINVKSCQKPSSYPIFHKSILHTYQLNKSM